MTGRYRITLADTKGVGRPERLTRMRWSIFAHTCESLAADGLEYAVTFALTGDAPHILITASGTPTRKARPVPLPRHGMVPLVKSQQCSVHAQEAEWFLPENRERRNNATTHWRRRAGRYAELNTMAEEELRAELEFWRELEMLSGQRRHFKPGRTDETENLDDEVAA
jgi:hypothetical protein